MRRRISITCLLLAWLCANGAVWNAVQLVAWAQMLHDNAQIMPVAQAIKVTFDGSKTCELCVFSQTAQETARDQLPVDAALGGTDKIVLALHVIAPLVLIMPDSVWPGVARDTGLVRTETVPVRPPRV